MEGGGAEGLCPSSKIFFLNIRFRKPALLVSAGKFKLLILCV